MRAHAISVVEPRVRRIAIELVLIPIAFYVSLSIHEDGHCGALECEPVAQYLIPITCIYI